MFSRGSEDDFAVETATPLAGFEAAVDDLVPAMMCNGNGKAQRSCKLSKVVNKLVLDSMWREA